MEGIRHFYDKLRSKSSDLLNKTTGDMKAEVINMTKSTIGGESYCAFLHKNKATEGMVGNPTAFVSHAWKYNFKMFFETLENKFEGQQSEFLWVDIFSHNQHEELTSEEWIRAFESHIKDIGRTLMVFSPWNDPIPLTRSKVYSSQFCSDCLINFFFNSFQGMVCIRSALHGKKQSTPRDRSSS